MGVLHWILGLLVTKISTALHNWRHWQGRLGRYNLTLMAALVAVHVLVLVAGRVWPPTLRVYTDDVALSLTALGSGKIWTLFTYAWLHDLQGIGHLLLNVLALGFFGAPYEQRYGSKAYLRLGVAAVVTGGVLQMLWQLVIGDGAFVVGASALTMGLLGAFAWANPGAEVLLFFAIRIQARWLVPLSLGLDALSALGSAEVALFAHVGGLAAAWFLVVGGGQPRSAWLRLRYLAARLAGKPLPSQRFRVIDGGKARRPPPDEWN